MKNKLINPIVIVANGKYPTHSYPLEVLDKAKTIICTDGSANKLQKHGVEPTFVIGDMDSIKNIKDFKDSEFLHIPRQDNTDLEKVLNYCVDSLIKEVTVLGATGIRDDLAFGKYFINIAIPQQIENKINYEHLYNRMCKKKAKHSLHFPVNRYRLWRYIV